MHIRSLLEGVIKVPKAIVDDVMNVVASDVLSRMNNYFTTTSDDDIDEYIVLFKRTVTEYKRLYGRFNLFSEHDEESVTRARVNLRLSDIDPRYRKGNKRPNNFLIDISIHTSPEFTGVGGEYHKAHRRTPARMTIEVPSQEYVESMVRSPELLATMMHRISGAVEHELMHAVQDAAFNRIPDDPAYYNDANNDIDNDKYYTAEFEFSPLIASNAKEFVAYARDVRQIGISLSPEEKSQMLKNFVDPTAKPPEVLDSATNVFFATLHRNDITKWKKAVKYFYGLVHDKF